MRRDTGGDPDTRSSATEKTLSRGQSTAGLHFCHTGPWVQRSEGPSLPGPRRGKPEGELALAKMGVGGVVKDQSHVGEPVVTSHAAGCRHAEIRPQTAVSAARRTDEGIGLPALPPTSHFRFSGMREAPAPSRPCAPSPAPRPTQRKGVPLDGPSPRARDAPPLSPWPAPPCPPIRAPTQEMDTL